jgi:hypothetical protein
MSWIAESEPAEHFECHVQWHLGADHSLPPRGTPNIAVLVAASLAKQFPPASEGKPPFEVTFMAVEEHDLDEMFQHTASGILPEAWVGSEE